MKYQNRNSRIKLEGFTLIELLVVLVIVGILVLLALPNLTPMINRARGMEAQLQLQHLHTLQKNHFYLHAHYSNDLEEIGFEQEKTVEEGGRANYQIEIVEATNSSFLARALAVSDFDGDGVLNEWHIDQDLVLTEKVKD